MDTDYTVLTCTAVVSSPQPERRLQLLSLLCTPKPFSSAHRKWTLLLFELEWPSLLSILFLRTKLSSLAYNCEIYKQHLICRDGTRIRITIAALFKLTPTYQWGTCDSFCLLLINFIENVFWYTFLKKDFRSTVDPDLIIYPWYIHIHIYFELLSLCYGLTTKSKIQFWNNQTF